MNIHAILGEKVLLASEMRRVEKKALQEGCQEEAFMDEAAQNCAKEILLYAEKEKRKKLVFLAGKGNNGGDGYQVALLLHKRNIEVIVYSLVKQEEGSFLCQKKRKAFQEAGGKVLFPSSVNEIQFPPQSLLIDVLLGTGFTGALEGFFLEVVQKANESFLPIVSIDIPSGLNGNTGEVLSEAIQSSQTIALGAYKTGYFLEKGYNYIGELKKVAFGLPQKYLQEADSSFLLLEKKRLCFHLPKIVPKRHKYEAGLVVGIAGSSGMAGAAKLSSLSCLRSGAGMLKLFFPQEVEKEMKDLPVEVLKEPLSKIEEISSALSKAKALFLGPGLGRGKKTFSFLAELFPQITLPAVVDADALFFLSENPRVKIPEKAIFTPHKKEMERLLGKSFTCEKEFHGACASYARDKKIVLLVKGAPTFIFQAGEKGLISPFGDPGMASAGTGDVLTGIIAAFLAQGLTPLLATCIGAMVHGMAGEKAAQEKTSYGVIASDLIEALPWVFKELTKLKDTLAGTIE